LVVVVVGRLGVVGEDVPGLGVAGELWGGDGLLVRVGLRAGVCWWVGGIGRNDVRSRG
jgi:hypothetical protein